jgi:hypothetical protein
MIYRKGELRTYQRLRTTGRMYAQARAGTIPPYRCYNAKEQSHFASNALDCEWSIYLATR